MNKLRDNCINMVDTPTPQVLIEARVVKATANFERELGVQWGGNFAKETNGEWGYALGNTPGDYSSRTGDSTSTFLAGNPVNDFLVDLPATLLGTGTPALGFQVGRLMGDIINLNLRLSAGETEGFVKTIARPKVITLDNIQASIKQGFEVAFNQPTSEGTPQVVFKEVVLQIDVKPHITPDERIFLDIKLTDDAIASVSASTAGPTIEKREAETSVLVRSGETVVVGGVISTENSHTVEGAPWFKDIPGMAWLFEKKSKRDRQSELLLFVTPFVVENV